MRDYWRNRLYDIGDFASRFIASWYRVGGELRRERDYKLFREWLRTLGLTEDDIDHIVYLAGNGKLEYEDSAREFINKNSIVKV